MRSADLLDLDKHIKRVLRLQPLCARNFVEELANDNLHLLESIDRGQLQSKWPLEALHGVGSPSDRMWLYMYKV